MEENIRSAYFEVTGGEPIQGSIAPQGNKNEALPALAACCLTEEALTFKNLPQIEDVDLMKKILKHLGADVEEKNGSVKVQAKKDLSSEIPRDLSAQLRGSVTLAGPLLARCGRVFLPKPGGDRIGRRRLDTHILALQELGAKISVHPDGFEIEADRLVGADIWLDEASVTATENAVLAATLAKGETVIRNAASEPHVQGLCHLLIKMGAKIDGVGSNILRVQGVDRLKGAAHRIGPDYLEVGSFIALAAVTGGELLIQDAGVENLRMIRMMFSKLGIETRVQGDDLFVPSAQSMEIISDLGGAIPSIDDAPWPGFPADMTSVALVTATQCKGTILIHEKMFESRLYFTDHLIGMGARIVLCDPHRAVIIGPEKLKGSTLTSPDIRAGMALLIAALCAEGTSIIQNIVQIDRGFADIDARLRLLGAKIERHNHSKR